MLTLGHRATGATRARGIVPSPRGERREFQIGPRIRVGGTIGKIGENVKNAIGKAATDTGHAVGDAASNPYVKAALAATLAGTGVGAPAAAAIMAGTGIAGGALKRGGGISPAIRGGISGAVTGAASGLAGTALREGVPGMIGGMVKDGVVGGGGGVLNRLRGLVSGGGADNTGNFGTLGDIAGRVLGGGGGEGDAGGSYGGDGGGGSGSSMMDRLLLGGSVASAAADRQRQQGLVDRSVNYATDPYDAKSGLRTRALAALSQDTPQPDLSGVFQNTGNVYDRQRRGMPTLTPRAPAAALSTSGSNLSGALTARAKASPMSALANSYQPT